MSDTGDITTSVQNLHDVDDELTQYQGLLRSPHESDGTEYDTKGVETAPLIWWEVKKHIDKISGTDTPLTQYAVLGHEPSTSGKPREPVLLNTKTPFSAFLCGSQGSGKSHTLSCMLENGLLSEDSIGKNPKPLAGLVLHYDGSRSTGVCEAAYLCSKVKTKILVSASNYGNLKKEYEAMASKCGGTIEVHKLLIATKYLDTERVKTLMAVTKDGDAPLYIQTLIKIIRDIAIENGGMGAFDYDAFKKQIEQQMFSERQNQPLKLRMDLLEAFLDLQADDTASESADYLVGKSGELIIVDLTDPVVDVDMACVLFETCLSIFLAQTRTQSGVSTIVALDEAHNYLLADNASAKQFTDRLLKTIREQRHVGARIVIATQEPTLDTSLLDLCSITMVHRCSSPAWFEVLKKHVAGLYLSSIDGLEATRKSIDRDLFRQIVGLKQGESLLFSPTAATEVEGENADGEGVEGGDGEAVDSERVKAKKAEGNKVVEKKVVRMLDGFVKLRTRARFTADGGQTKLADSK